MMELEKKKKPPNKTIFSNSNKKAGVASKFEIVCNLKGKIQEEKKLLDETIYITNREKAKKDKTKIKAKLKNGKKQDLNRLDMLQTKSEQKSELEETVFGANKEAKEFEKVSKPEARSKRRKSCQTRPSSMPTRRRRARQRSLRRPATFRGRCWCSARTRSRPRTMSSTTMADLTTMAMCWSL